MSETPYRVTWTTPFSQGTDFLMPGQGTGEKRFATIEEARAFAQNLQANGLKVGPRAGEEIFGHELKITIHRPATDR